MSDWWFSGWSSVIRTIAVGAAAYALLVVMVRVSGKRTLAKMNAFDLVVTVAIGSSLSTILLSSDTSLAQGAAGFATLIALQVAVAWLAARWGWFEGVVKASPGLLVYRGRMLRDAMRRERVSEEAIRTAMRDAGVGSLGDVYAVVLESNGDLTCLRSDAAAPDALADVEGGRRAAASGETVPSGRTAPHDRRDGI